MKKNATDFEPMGSKSSKKKEFNKSEWKDYTSQKEKNLKQRRKEWTEK